MVRKFTFENNYYYHIYNRGVEKRIIFLDDEDYLRFIYYLYEFNSIHSVGDIAFNIRKIKINKFGTPISEENKLVDIICFVLMPNHFHLLIRQDKDRGISLFMQKVSLAYTKYFNEKYMRVGSLFQGAFKAKLINKNEYLNYLFYYILGNPIELIESQWKKVGIKNYKNIKKFLESYRWSSYRDFIEKLNFPFLINKNNLAEFFNSHKSFTFKQFILDLVKNNEICEMHNLTFE